MAEITRLDKLNNANWAAVPGIDAPGLRLKKAVLGIYASTSI
jgi:hypothetical protein